VSSTLVRSSLLVSAVLMFAVTPALADWKYLAPGAGEPNVHRAFTFAEDSDDRLEFACNKDRIDFFYVAKHTVSGSELASIKSGKPETLVRLEGAGLVALNAQEVAQNGDRLTFVTEVIPAFVKDLGKSQGRFVAGMRSDGRIVRQGMFPAAQIQRAMSGLASGCGF